jgi:hypothetical protein
MEQWSTRRAGAAPLPCNCDGRGFAQRSFEFAVAMTFLLDLCHLVYVIESTKTTVIVNVGYVYIYDRVYVVQFEHRYL